MPHAVHIEIGAPFQLGDVVADVTHAGGTTRVVLRGGVFDGELPAAATSVRLSIDEPSDGSTLAPERFDLPAKQAPSGPVVPIDALFEKGGVAVPADGRLVVQLAWGMPCASKPPPEDAVDKTRFGSWEHILTAEWVGLDANDQPLAFGPSEPLTKETKLPVGDGALTFGQIIALSGDYYAHLDDEAARTPEIAAAWPAIGGVTGFFAGDYRETTLRGDSQKAREAILAIVFRDRDADEHGGALGEAKSGAVDALFHGYPLRRYGALASQNYCHFGAQPWDGSIDDASNDALRMYRLYHRRALAEAARAGAAQDEAALRRALVVAGFACHFLTDLFASGHLRVPRRALTERLGIVRGGSASKDAHDEDNAGLWVRMRKNPPGKPLVVWRAYGDNFLRTNAGLQHLAMVREAVRRCVEEVCARYAGVEPSGIAEDMLPVVLPSGEGPKSGHVPPDADVLGSVHAAHAWPAGAPKTNAFPLYVVTRDGRLARRVDAGPRYAIVGGEETIALGAGA